MNTTTTPIAASFEIVFDNGGGAVLQNHEGTVAIRYNDMAHLAHDVKQLDNGDDATAWDGIDLSEFISDEEYEKHMSSGGLQALQLDPEYRDGWISADDASWNNVADFLRAFEA